MIGDSLFCGGSIISDEWIITSAACVSVMPDLLQIRSGSNLAHDGGILHNPLNIIRHEHYKRQNKTTAYYDIALIRLRPPFNFDKTREPIQLFDKNDIIEPNQYGIISGWGRTSLSGHASDILKSVNVTVIDKWICKKLYGNEYHIFDDHICTANPQGGLGHCHGDSGGPLVINGRLAGIISWGKGCALANYPDVYTEIAYHQDWIERHVNF